ncbi:hypothetical protein Aduo_015407 [Ancylostoma duodenale]
MDTVLHGLLGNEVFCYIDDIMICTSTRERHLELLREICQRMRKANMRLKARKCVLLQKQVTFLGHVIDAEGVHMSPEKIETIVKYPTPDNAKELRTFLGMASFYRKFCLGFAKATACLFSLTSPEAKWRWEQEHVEAFETMKKMICTAPVLAQPDIDSARKGTRPFIIFTDASTEGLGAVLSQEGEDKQLHPIFFASKGLSKAEKRYHVTDLEALAVVFAVRRFHMFIYGLLTIVKTDHQPLTALFERTNVSARVLRWSLELQRYNLEIQYVKGTANAVADALSRGAAKINDADTLESLKEAVVNAVKVGKKTKWLEQLEKDDQFGLVIDLLRKNELDDAVKLAGLKHPVRVADFAIIEGNLRFFTEEGNDCMPALIHVV